MINDLEVGRDRRRRAVGADGGLLCQAGKSAAARRVAGQGDDADRSWCIASAWACARPTRTGNGSSTGSSRRTSRAINKILLDFGVPLLDENNQPIGAEAAAKSP